VTNTDAAIAALLKAKEETIKQTDGMENVWQVKPEMVIGTKWYKYTHQG